jgi:taurine--2-oxoglutarate transaminase
MNSFLFTWNKQSNMVPLPVERGGHDEMILPDGRRIYDFISTSFQASFGHSHPQILKRISDQMGIMSIGSPKATFPLKEQVSPDLVRLVNRGAGKIFYTVSGAESVENAIKQLRSVFKGCSPPSNSVTAHYRLGIIGSSTDCICSPRGT